MKLNGSGQVFCNLADKEKHRKVYQKKTFNPLNYMAKVTALFSRLFASIYFFPSGHGNESYNLIGS